MYFRRVCESLLRMARSTWTSAWRSAALRRIRIVTCEAMLASVGEAKAGSVRGRVTRPRLPARGRKRLLLQLDANFDERSTPEPYRGRHRRQRLPVYPRTAPGTRRRRARPDRELHPVRQRA